MGVRIDGSNDVVSAADGSLTVDGLSLSVTGIITASGGFKVGSAYTAYSNGNVETTGIVTTSGGLNVTDGNVGIGTNIAGTLLELNGKSAKEATVTFNRQPVQGTNDGTIGQFIFENNTDSVALLAVKRQSAADDAYMQFATQGTGGGLTERLRINSTGQVLIGATSAEASHGDRVQINSTTGVAVHRGAASAAGPRVDLTKSRNTTYTSNTIVQSGDLLGSIFFRGDDGTDYNSAGAQIFAAVDGTPGTNDMPGRLVFATTSDGNNSATERLRITSAGDVGIGTATPTAKLHVDGDARITGIVTVGTGSLTIDGDEGTINGVVHPTSGALSNRNLIINGAMKVAQRGATITGIGVDDYTCCDRFKHFASVSGQAGRLTASQENITDLAGFNKALKLQVTTTETPGSTESYGLNTRLELQDIKGLNIGSSSSIPLTLSFYAKAPTGNGVFCAGIMMPGGGTYIEEVTIGTSWSRHEINIPATTTSAHATTNTTDNHSGMEVQITLMAGSSRNGHAGNTWETGTNDRATSNQSNFFSSTSNNLWITGVQLERGEKATPFEHRSYDDELDRCYRYYQNSFGLGNVPGTSTDLGDSIITTSWTDGNAPFPQFARPMRVAPSVTLRPRGETNTGQVENGSVDRNASAQQVNEKSVGYLAVTNGTGGQFNAFTYVLECDM